MDWPELSLYLIDRKTQNRLAEDPLELGKFLSHELARIEHAWKNGAPTWLIANACGSLRVSLNNFHAGSISAAKLLVIEADARLSLVDERQVNAAFDLAEEAIEVLSSPRVSTDEADRLNWLSEAVLIGAVALKALGMRSESLEYMRDASSKVHMNDLTALPLLRQSVMMTEELAPHLALLTSAGVYRSVRPREYYRTMKRVFEALLRDGQYRIADSLLPELMRSFVAAREQLSISARVSILKNLGQYFALQGDDSRALRMFAIALTASEQFGLHGSKRQLSGMIDDLRGGGQPTLRTFVAIRQ